MKSYRFLVVILLIPFQLFAQKNSNPWPGKEKIRLGSVIDNRVSLYAEVLDKLGKDIIITEFILMDFKAGSIIEDQTHNEGDAFLFYPIENGFTLTLIDEVRDEKGKLPAVFKQHKIIVMNKKLQVTEKFISSSHIIPYLKRFKKYQKMR